MKKIIKNISLLLCALVILASCERKPLYDSCICTNSLSIPINVDWETSGVTPQNVSVLFYNAADGTLAYEHTYEHNSKDIQSYASLPEGNYTAVVFNELRNQIDYITCTGHENISTLKFEGNEDDPLRSRTVTRSYIKQSGDLAVSTIEGINVTSDMIVEAAYADDDETKSTELSAATKTTVESLMNVVPLKKNSTINITVHVKNIYYSRMPALVDLVNIADGYYVYGDKNSDTPATLQFTMNNRTYDDGSFYDGTISASIVTFGTMTDRFSASGHDDTTPITLDILFQLIDTDVTETSRDIDVTDLIVFTEESDGSITLTINASIEEPLPEVIPDGSSGESGFGSVLVDWESVDVTLGL